MTIARAEIGREIPKNQQYLKAREQAFAELLDILKKNTGGNTINKLLDDLPDVARKYCQFLAVSDRELLTIAILDWIRYYYDHASKKEAWAKILSVVMSSGVNRCDVNSPGISEVARLIPLSPFKDAEIVANVSAHTIISPNEILQLGSHHEHYLEVRRLVYESIANYISSAACGDICMGAEYFVAGRLFWESGHYKHWGTGSLHILRVVEPIDRRG